MSQFQGYMGGEVGQGIMGSDNTNQLPYNPHQLSPQSQTPTQSSLPPPTTSSGGSITQFYQQAQQQHYPASVSTLHPMGQQSQMTSYSLQQPATGQPATGPSHQFQVHPQPYVQYQPQQNASYMQATRNALPQMPVPPISPQPSGRAPLSHQDHQQSAPYHAVTKTGVSQYQAHESIPPHQPAPAGSYAERSAQAHATLGPPSTIKQMLPSFPASTASTVTLTQAAPVKQTNYDDSPVAQAQQTRILTDCTRKVQEHAYYMKQAMDKDDVSSVLDRAASMVGELGDASSGLLTPKNYYELHMRALDDMPNLEEYFLSLTGPEKCLTMKDLYAYVQYCPKVLSRLYLQVSAGSALIRSKEETAKNVMTDLIEAVKCVQNPLRGLFLRHFLLQATRDKLPDGDQVKDAYDFVLANFVEMNRLWVRIQHLPGDGKSKEQRKRRERERNELRILVGTNLVRLSQLEGVSSKIYGEVILPKILEQITACGDPLAQAYLIDCIIQVFPDEYHIETLPILLPVCPKLRDKVNIRTIMQSLMDRLANYYAEEELLDEVDSNDVKKSIFRDSFPMFEDCVQKVFQARGPKLVSREVIRLQTALLTFSIKCYPGNMEQVSRCLGVCIDYIRQAANATAIANQTPFLEDSAIRLDQASISELEKLLSIPLDSMALKVLELEHYADLLQFLPWQNRRDVGMKMLRAIDASGTAPATSKELEELFSIILPVIRQERTAHDVQTGLDRFHEMQEENTLVSKLVHLLDHENPDIAYDMLAIARSHLSEVVPERLADALVPVVFAALRLANKVAGDNTVKKVQGDQKHVDTNGGEEKTEDAMGGLGEMDKGVEVTNEVDDKNPVSVDEKRNMEGTQDEHIVLPVTPVKKSHSLSCRKVLVFIQTTITMLAKGNPELGVKLYLQTALAADGIHNLENSMSLNEGFQQIASELLAQAFLLHEEEVSELGAQLRCVVNMIGALLACRSLTGKDYEGFITKAAQYAAKLAKKQDQCRMVALCSHLFYAVGTSSVNGYQNPQRTLECLQRSLKLADASVTVTPSNIYLFVDLLEHYLCFYEENNPLITEAYITGLVALIKEHLDSLSGLGGTDAAIVSDARSHFEQVVAYIKRKKSSEETAERFAKISLASE